MSKEKVPYRSIVTQAVTNILFSIIVFILFIFVMHYVGISIEWNTTMILSIVASVFGVAYILTIKNPVNFTGHYLGVMMSVFLGFQFFTIESYDMTVLYLAVFLPLQVKTAIEWKRSWKSANVGLDEYVEFKPKFLTPLKMLYYLGAFVLIAAADVLVLIYVMQTQLPMFAIICSAIVVASCALANVLLINKKIDSWIYWVTSNVFNIIFAVITVNQFNIVLFIFLLVLNSMAGLQWFRMRCRN